MSDDPAGIINEYLTLVREKLPESIADDVISELEMYMLETAKDQGEDGKITIESAKKVVAQFGAPGEVADEYRFSMLPETIPEEDIPVEIKQDTAEIAKEQTKVEPEEAPPKVPGVDPTTSYTTFFFKSLILTLIWASIVAIFPAVMFPFWPSSVQLIFIIMPVSIVTVYLLVQTSYLKGRKTILWKRSYPDWSIFQTLVTLPENAIPEAGINQHRLDIVASVIGLFLFVPLSTQWYHPISVFVAIPAVILLSARIFLTVKKLDEDKDPYAKAKQEFVVNLSLLLILESSIYLLFYPYGWWNSLISWIAPFVTTYVIIFGAMLLFCLLIGTQNLWWKTDEQLTIVEIVASEESVPTKEKDFSKQDLEKSIPSKGLGMFIGISSRLLLFMSLPFIVRLSTLPATTIYNSEPIPSYLFISVILAVIIAIGYCVYRGLMIHFFDSSTFIGTRTRLEAIIDLGISCFLMVGVIAYANSTGVGLLQYLESHASEIFSANIYLGGIVVGFQLTAIILAITGLPVRIIGNILEFWSERKHIATMRIQDSSIILFVALLLFATSDYVKYIVSGNVHLIIFFFPMYFLIAGYLTYQMVASGMKIEEITEQKEKVIAEKSQKVHSMNNNATMAN